MFVAGRLAASQVRFELNASGVPVASILASPIPLTPVVRDVVVDEGNAYLVGRIRIGGNLLPESHWPKRDPYGDDEDPAVAQAAATPAAAIFLSWARYPTYVVDHLGNTTVVHFIDLRYARSPDASFGTLSVPVSTAQLAFLPLP